MECPVDEAGLRFLFAYVANATFRGLVDAEQPHEKLSKGALQAAVAILPRLSTAAYNAASPSGKPLDGNAVRLDFHIYIWPPSEPPSVTLFVRDTVRLREVFTQLRSQFGMGKTDQRITLAYVGKEFGVMDQHDLLSKWVVLPVKWRRPQRSVAIHLIVPASIFTWPAGPGALLRRACHLCLRNATLRNLRIKCPPVWQIIWEFLGFDA